MLRWAAVIGANHKFLLSVLLTPFSNIRSRKRCTLSSSQVIQVTCLSCIVLKLFSYFLWNNRSSWRHSQISNLQIRKSMTLVCVTLHVERNRKNPMQGKVFVEKKVSSRLWPKSSFTRRNKLLTTISVSQVSVKSHFSSVLSCFALSAPSLIHWAFSMTCITLCRFRGRFSRPEK